MTIKTADVRTWARQNGKPVGARGRISPDLVAAYEAANGGGVERTRPGIVRTVYAKARWDA